jgi:hypothetical protein
MCVAEFVHRLFESVKPSREVDDLTVRGVRLDKRPECVGAPAQRDFPLSASPSQVDVQFIEAICKTILTEKKIPLKGNEKLPKLVHMAIEEINTLDTAHLNGKTDPLIRKTLGVLSTLTQCIAELRNLYGTGHGRDAGAIGLKPRHAELAVNASTTLALFLYRSYNVS